MVFCQAMRAAADDAFVFCFFPCIAVQALMALAPKTALLVQLDVDGNVVAQEEVHSSLIHQGDVLKVKGWVIVARKGQRGARKG